MDTIPVPAAMISLAQSAFNFLRMIMVKMDLFKTRWWQLEARLLHSSCSLTAESEYGHGYKSATGPEGNEHLRLIISKTEVNHIPHDPNMFSHFDEHSYKRVAG